jgi:FkbM family methyltransferase
VLVAAMNLGTVKRSLRAALGDHRVRWVKVRRMRVMERLPGIAPPFTGLDGLDSRLIPLVAGAASPTFLEFGANDGVQQSNTYVLERDHRWSGVLVEPVVRVAAECARNRPRARVVCGAVSSPDVSGSVLGFEDRDLMSAQGSGPDLAVAVTVSSLIDDLLGGTVGLVVIDVEGFELAALAGLDLERHQPEFLLVETATPDAVASLLGERYGTPVALSYHDYLFARA